MSLPKDRYLPVCYKELLVDVGVHGLADQIARVLLMSPEHRTEMQVKVVRALDEACDHLTKHGKFNSEEQRQNACDDVVIWFATEVVEGRASQYQQRVH